MSTPVYIQSEGTDWVASTRCFVYRELGSGSFNNVGDVVINAIFDGELYLRQRWSAGDSEFDWQNHYLQIQLVPPFPSWYVLEGKRFAVTMGGDSTANLVRSASFDSDPRPRFDFRGDAANELTRRLAEGKDIHLTIQYDPNSKMTVSLTAGQVLNGWAKFESCISRLHQDKEY